MDAFGGAGGGRQNSPDPEKERAFEEAGAIGEAANLFLRERGEQSAEIGRLYWEDDQEEFFKMMRDYPDVVADGSLCYWQWVLASGVLGVRDGWELPLDFLRRRDPGAPLAPFSGLVEEMCSSRLSLYEVQEAEEDRIRILDLLAPEAEPVWASRQGCRFVFLPWDVAGMRVLAQGRGFRLAPGVHFLSRPAGLALARRLRRDARENAGAASPRPWGMVVDQPIVRTWFNYILGRDVEEEPEKAVPNHGIPELDEMVRVRDLYRVDGWDAFSRSMDKERDVVRLDRGGPDELRERLLELDLGFSFAGPESPEPEKAPASGGGGAPDGSWKWYWTESGAGGGRQVVASLIRTPEGLLVSTLEEGASDAAGDMIRRAAGPNAVFVKRTVESAFACGAREQREQKEGTLKQDAWLGGTCLSPCRMRLIMWTTRPEPLLGGRTPEAAARIPGERAKVANIIKGFEHLEAIRVQKEGGERFSFDFLWKKLGLDPGIPSL